MGHEEHNAQFCFDGKVSKVVSLADKVKFIVVSWISILPHFQDYSFDTIMMSWNEEANSSEVAHLVGPDGPLPCHGS